MPGFRSRTFLSFVMSTQVLHDWEAVQDKAWDNYVVAGFNDQPDVYESGELWVLVDMLIQFKVQIKGLDKNSKITTLMKKKKCGQCSVCSCKKDVKVEYQ